MRRKFPFLDPGEEVGEHVTDNREEVIVVLKGKAALVQDGKECLLEQGDAYFIKEGVKHNVKNAANSDLEYVYIVG